jgi:cold shock protein
MARDVFVHYSEIGGYRFRSLKENRHVEFEVIQGLAPAGHHVRAA